MSWKKIIALIALLVVLMVAVFLVDRKEAEKAKSEGKLYTLTADRVQKIEIQRRDEVYLFTRTGGEWKLEKPIQAKADKIAVENIVDQFAALKYERSVEKVAVDLAKYGLDQPRIRVSLFEEKAEKPAYTVLIGIQNEMDQTSYATLAAGGEVVLVGSTQVTSLEKGVFDFRDKKFMGMESGDIDRFSYRREGVEIAFQKKDARWLLEKPVLSLAEESKVSDILYKASALEAKSFKGTIAADKLSDYGLDQPILEAEFRVKGTARTVKVGEKGETFYALAPHFGEVCEIDKDFAEKLSKEYEPFRSRKAASFYAYDVREIQYKSGPLEMNLKRNQENNWEWGKKTGKGSPDSEKVNSLLTALEGLTAVSFVDSPDRSVAFPHRFDLQVEDYASKARKTVTILLSDLSGEAVFAKSPDFPYYLTVAKDILDKLPKKLADLEKADTKENI